MSADVDTIREKSLGELLAVIASEARDHPFVGSGAQKQAWDEVKSRHSAALDRLAAAEVQRDTLAASMRAFDDVISLFADSRREAYKGWVDALTSTETQP